MQYQGNAPDPEHLVLMGKVAKPHGIKGEIKVFSYSGRPEDFNVYRQIILYDSDSGAGKEFESERCRIQGKFSIIKLRQVDTRNASESLSGLTVWVYKEQMPPLGPDEFYWHEMIGLDVFSGSDENLGKVTSLFSTPAHDVLVVKGKGREYLIPAKKEFIQDMDLAAKRLIIRKIDGLLEMND